MTMTIAPPTWRRQPIGDDDLPSDLATDADDDDDLAPDLATDDDDDDDLPPICLPRYR